MGSTSSLTGSTSRGSRSCASSTSGAGEKSYVARAIGNLLASAPDLDDGPRPRRRATTERLCSVTHRLAGAALNLGATLGR